MKIVLNDIKKCFGEKVAVDIPQLEISGGVVGLVGNNGAGKTTLFRLLLDLINRDEGSVALHFSGSENSIDPTKSEEWKTLTGAYIDDGFLIDFLTPEEYFEFVGRASGLTKDEISTRIEAYTQFMAGEVMGQKKLIRDYSAGNRHKIGIIAAMLHRPELLILDEPFNFLDPSSQNHLKKLLEDYAAQTGAIVIVSSHNLQHTVDISERVLLMEHGRIINDIDNTDHSAETILDSYFNAPEVELTPNSEENEAKEAKE